jgi:hypothetical protein
MDEPTGKRCTKCGQVKALKEFGTNRAAADGLTHRCLECRRQDMRDQYAADPEAARERARRQRATNPEASREAARQSMHRWRITNNEAARERDRRWYESYKTQVFDHYGRACACCGATERLNIDHVNGDGKRHREELKGSSKAFYHWLIVNGFPDGFQTLCAPCNVSKRNGPRCRIDHAAA